MVFNTKSMSILAEQINNHKISLTGPEFFSAIIYAGAKSCNPDFTEEEANALYIQLEESCPNALNGIVEEYCDASGVDSDALKKSDNANNAVEVEEVFIDIDELFFDYCILLKRSADEFWESRPSQYFIVLRNMKI